MRLLSITVRSYRLHEDLTVELDPARTLIGGPNESGKSTLVEAAHRALFLRAKVTGEAQKSMVSDRHDGHPEVEVRFEAGGKDYRISKRFSGASGTATLNEEGGATWQQDEAETKLQELLGVEDVGGGRGVAERSAKQWGHLWVWQGEGGGDPSEHADHQRDSLLSRLKEEGGAVAMESELDSRVAAAIAEKNAETYTARGGVAAQSGLKKANDDLEAAGEKAREAGDALRNLEDAAAKLTTAIKTIEEKQADLKTHAASKKETEVKLEQAGKLQHRLEMEKKDGEQAIARHEELKRVDGELAKLAKEIRTQSDALKPVETQEKELADEAERKKESRAQAATEKRQLDQALRTARVRHELAKAWQSQFECQEQKDRLTKLHQEAGKLRAEIQSLVKDLAKLPGVTTKALASLQSLETGLSRARAALDAMASGITVEQSDLPVQVGEESLAPGDKHIITEETRIDVGEDTRLLISPGGGTSLAEARTRVEAARDELTSGLEQIPIASLEEAVKINGQRQDLESRLNAKRAELQGMDADTIEDDLAAAITAKEAADAEVQRRAEAVEDDAAMMPAPESLAAAKDMANERGIALEQSENKDVQAVAKLDAAESAFQKAEESHRQHRTGSEEAVTRLKNLRIKAQTREESHGDASAREEKLTALAAERKTAEEKMAATEKELKNLQPDSLDAALTRFDRAIEQARGAIGEAEQEKAVARNILARDGTQDPAETLALANAAVESARRRQQAIERKALAIQMLNGLFSEKQRELAHQFTGPLAERITGYLQQLFGPGAAARIEMSDKKFEKPVLVREGQAFDFDVLSGGTREQVAAAFRLAMAEILAEKHDGCLPVVFDDAFTNSDPSRIHVLQGMLDLAATRGLQVILLTCDPSDYSALGAKSVTL